MSSKRNASNSSKRDPARPAADGRAADGRPARPMELKEHLDACTQKEMEEFLRFWSPHERLRGNGRDRLGERLMRLMSDENVVYAKVDMLSERVRAVLLALLRRTHYTSDLQGLFRGVDGLDLEFYEGEAALTALAKRGFVRISRAHDWLHYGRSAYAIPLEVALVMRGLAGTDSRPLDQILVHGNFRPSAVEAAASEPLGALPESIDAAIEALPREHLRIVSREVIERYGGIITRHEFGDAYEEREICWESAPFLRVFGGAGLGTVGHLDMRTKGIGVDDDVLVFFQEAVERSAEEARARPLEYDRALSAHGDLMSDLRTALAMIQESSVRVSKEGLVYKSSRAKLAERLQFPGQPLLTPEEIADRVFETVRELGLAETNVDGQLALTGKGEAWGDGDLVEKVRDAYAHFLREGVETLRARHLRGVFRIIVGLLQARGDDESWWPGMSLAMVARNRYLLELAGNEAPPTRTPLSVRHQALTQLGCAAQDLLVHDLFALGMVEVAMVEEDPVGVRLSRLGRRVVLDSGTDFEGLRPLVVNPDFEMLVLPEGDVDDLLHDLDRIATRVRTGEVVHYRLDRERIERMTAAGECPEAIIEFLQQHCRSALPQNVAYSIRSWSAHVKAATMARGILFKANDPTVIDAILGHAVLKECVAEVVGPTVVFFHDKATEREISTELRSLGIYVS